MGLDAFLLRPPTPRRLPAAFDFLVYVLILSLGVLQFLLPQSGDDFFHGDAIYAELARAIVERGTYRLDFNDVIYPPGFPALLALLSTAAGDSHAVLVRAMSVFVTLGLVASYRLLRGAEGRAMAATACLLFASSPDVFEFSTQWVYSDLPFFAASMSTLVVASLLDAATSARARLLLGLLCTTLLLSCLLIRSSGVALVAGLAGWLVLGGLGTDRATRRRRLKGFAIVLIAGVVLQGAWMTWVARHETIEWPMLEGHPRSYLSQLKVKSGVRPELGTASPVDVLSRVPENLLNRAAGLMELVTHADYISPAWYSPLVLGSVLLIAAGLGSSLRGAGGSLAEWYFMAHEGMYLIWPWPFEMRFLIPVAPLACLYLWRGAAAIGRGAARSPGAVGLAGLLIGLPAGAAAAFVAWPSGAMQPRLGAIAWALVAAASLWLRRSSSSERLPGPPAQGRFAPTAFVPKWLPPSSLPRFGAIALVGTLVARGIDMQVEIGRKNLQFDETRYPALGRVAAARWVAEHSPTTAVIMAQQQDVVHRYSNRKVVWLPPLSNPQQLLQGIRRLKVDYIVVTNVWTYYVPSETESIDALLTSYPDAFRIAHDEPRFKIIEVVHPRASPNDD